MKNNDFALIESGHYRKGTRIKKCELNLVYACGGVGDYIQWTTAIDWSIANHPFLTGTVSAPTYFYDLANHWLKKHSPRFKVRAYKTLKDDFFTSDRLFRYPHQYNLINSGGFHLLPLGFHFYANLDYIPEGWNKIPQIYGHEASIKKFNLPKQYAVVTTEATSPVRTLKAEAINGQVEFIKSKGIPVVFMGKKDLAHDYKSHSEDGINLDGIIDLREKTSLIEAAVILSKAEFVTGLDNGLLHLACCSEVPVVFAFSSVDPRHRIPPRRGNAKTYIISPPKSLPCRYCQSNMKFMINHDFRKCVYNDKACLDFLTSNLFNNAIERILCEKSESKSESQIIKEEKPDSTLSL